MKLHQQNKYLFTLKIGTLDSTLHSALGGPQFEIVKLLMNVTVVKFNAMFCVSNCQNFTLTNCTLLCCQVTSESVRLCEWPRNVQHTISSVVMIFYMLSLTVVHTLKVYYEKRFY